MIHPEDHLLPRTPPAGESRENSPQFLRKKPEFLSPLSSSNQTANTFRNHLHFRPQSHPNNHHLSHPFHDQIHPESPPPFTRYPSQNPTPPPSRIPYSVVRRILPNSTQKLAKTPSSRASKPSARQLFTDKTLHHKHIHPFSIRESTSCNLLLQQTTT